VDAVVSEGVFTIVNLIGIKSVCEGPDSSNSKELKNLYVNIMVAFCLRVVNRVKAI
jgi:hypothetical protein